jgi:hypothetical protein
MFVNICYHENLAIPALKKKLDDSGQEIEGINIPMSVGPLRKHNDKSGKACNVYDIIVNPKVIDDVNEDKVGTYRDFVCQLAIQSLEQKYKITLDHRYKLPKLKYFGDINNIPSQNIQDRSKVPTIEEINDDHATISKKSEAAKRAELDKAKALADAKALAILENEIDLHYTMSWLIFQNKKTNEQDVVENEMKEEDILLEEVPLQDIPPANTYIEPMMIPHLKYNKISLNINLDTLPDVDNNLTNTAAISPYKMQVKININFILNKSFI